MKSIYAIVGLLAAVASPARADDAPAAGEELTPGLASPQPIKAALPLRDNPVVRMVSAELSGGSTFGASALFSSRFWESVGLGLGYRIADDGGLFLRAEFLGFAFDHWAFVGYADFVARKDIWVGAAAIIPVFRNNYVRVSLAHVDYSSSSMNLNTILSVGMEHDLW